MGSIPITRFRAAEKRSSRRPADYRTMMEKRRTSRTVLLSVREGREDWGIGETSKTFAAVAQSVERVLGKDEVLGSNPSGSFLGPGPKLWAVRVTNPAVGTRTRDGRARRGRGLTWGAAGRSSAVVIDSRDAVRR